jgi:hypothetical protein
MQKAAAMTSIERMQIATVLCSVRSRIERAIGGSVRCEERDLAQPKCTGQLAWFTKRRHLPRSCKTSTLSTKSSLITELGLHQGQSHGLNLLHPSQGITTLQSGLAWRCAWNDLRLSCRECSDHCRDPHPPSAPSHRPSIRSLLTGALR